MRITIGFIIGVIVTLWVFPQLDGHTYTRSMLSLGCVMRGGVGVIDLDNHDNHWCAALMYPHQEGFDQMILAMYGVIHYPR